MDGSNISEIIRTSLENIREMADVNTVVGEPINTVGGTVIIPVSKISIGFASGGLDYFSKKQSEQEQKNARPSFGGGGGTGMSVTPLGFLVIHSDGSVDLLDLAAPMGARESDKIDSIGNIIEKSPDIISRLKEVFSKDGKDKKKESDGGEKV